MPPLLTHGSNFLHYVFIEIVIISVLLHILYFKIQSTVCLLSPENVLPFKNPQSALNSEQ